MGKIFKMKFIFIAVLLIRLGKSAPSSEYTPDPGVGGKTKRSADLINFLSSMLADYANDDGVDGGWPDYLQLFNSNDRNAYANQHQHYDYDKGYIDYNDQSDLCENYNPYSSLEYNWPEEESNEIIQLDELNYKNHKNPLNTDHSGTSIDGSRRSMYESDYNYGPIDWNDITPTQGHHEIDESISENLFMAPPKFDMNNYSNKGTKSNNSPKPKFDIFNCFSEARQQTVDEPVENERKHKQAKNIFGDEYLVLVIKKDHVLGGKGRDNRPESRNQPSEVIIECSEESKEDKYKTTEQNITATVNETTTNSATATISTTESPISYTTGVVINTNEIVAESLNYSTTPFADDETESQSTESSTTECSTVQIQTTDSPTTNIPTTERPTTESPTTKGQTTEWPTTECPTTKSATTASPTIESSTTASSATEYQLTELPLTESPTAESPTSESSGTEHQLTELPSTESPATEYQSTEIPSTESPATESPTSESSVTEYQSTKRPTTENSATEYQSTEISSTKSPETESPASESSATDHQITDHDSITTKSEVTTSPTESQPTKYLSTDSYSQTTDSENSSTVSTTHPDTAILVTTGSWQYVE